MSDGGAQHRHLSLGETYASFTIDFYAAGTSTDKEVWTAEDKTGSTFRITADTAGIATWYADGDYKMICLTSVGGSIFTWDNVKMTSDTATLWEGNFGVSFPTAVTSNRWQQFAKVTANNELNFLGINTGTEFQTYAQPIGKGADIVSAAALTPGTDGDYFDVTGSTTITSIASLGEGTTIRLHFDGVVTLTHNATNLVLHDSTDITTIAGEELSFFEYAVGSWRMLGKSSFVIAPGSIDTLQIASNAINADKIQAGVVGLSKLGSYHGALVGKTGSQSIPNTTFTTLSFETEGYDTDDIHSVISDIGALKVPTIGGTNVSRVRLQANVRFNLGVALYGRLKFYKNNAVYTYAGSIASYTDGSNPCILNLISPVLYVIPGDDFHAVVIQTSGGAVDVLDTDTWFSMEILR